MNKDISKEQLTVQLDIAMALAKSGTLKHAANRIIKILCNTFHFVIGELWAINHEEKVLRKVVRWNSPHINSQLPIVNYEMAFRRAEGIPGKIWEHKEPMWVDFATCDTSLRDEFLINNGLNTCVGLPIIFKEEVIGVLLFFAPAIAKPNEQYIELLNAVGRQIGTIIKYKRLDKDLLYLAHHDPLTGLANKIATEKSLENVIERAKVHHTMVALLYIDIDHFKKINDSLGHEKGDSLLQEIAKRLQQNIRETDIIARFSGDEFIIVLPDIKLKEHVVVFAKKILTIMHAPFNFGKKEFYLTVSIGMSLFPEDSEDIPTLFRMADMALYHVKRNGRNNYAFAEQKTEKKDTQKIKMEVKLFQALNQNEFGLSYQPILNLKTNQLVSLEAIIFWNKSQKKYAPFLDLMPLPEQTNLILSFNEWLFRTVCQQLNKWHQARLDISINIPIYQPKIQLVKLLKTILDETKTNPANIRIEISASLLNDNTVLDVIKAFYEIGTQVVIEQFGMGYFSFEHLKTLSIHAFKIAESYIADLEINPKSALLIEAIISMAHVFGIHTIATAVETKEQLQFLARKNCDLFQGNYYCKPLPPEELEVFFKNRKIIID